MDEILSKIKISIDSPTFTWMKSLTINTPNFISLPEQRENELNAILAACCIILVKDYKMQITEFTQQVYENCKAVISLYIRYCCELYLYKNNVTLNVEKLNILYNKIVALNFPVYIEGVLNVRSKGVTDPIHISNDIKNLIFDDITVQPEFVKTLVSEFFINNNISNLYQTEVELNPGMNVCNCELVEKIYQSSKKDGTIVWKAKRGQYFVALKMEKIKIPERILKQKTNNMKDNIVDYIKENDEEFINWVKIKAFSYKSQQFTIDYYQPLNMSVKIMTLFDSSIKDVQINDKQNFVFTIGMMFFELHKLGLVYNNLCMEHIMIGKDENNTVKYFLVDYKNITSNKSQINYERISQNCYNSLSIFLNNPSIYSFYDDIESMFYLFDDVLVNNKKEYEDLHDQINKKQNLTVFSAIIAEQIINLRNLRNNDIYVNSFDNPPDMSEYITQKYTNSQNQIICISQMINNIITTIKDVAYDTILKLNTVDLALFNQIKNLLTLDATFNGINIPNLALLIVNYFRLGVKPDDYNMELINRFVNSSIN